MVVAHGGDRSSNLANTSREAAGGRQRLGGVMAAHDQSPIQFCRKAVIRKYFTQLTGLFKT